MSSAPRWYTLEQASELSGLSPDLVWAVCDRLGCPEDAVPAKLVLKLRHLVGATVEAVVCGALDTMETRQGRRATA